MSQNRRNFLTAIGGTFAVSGCLQLTSEDQEITRDDRTNSGEIGTQTAGEQSPRGTNSDTTPTDSAATEQSPVRTTDPATDTQWRKSGSSGKQEGLRLEWEISGVNSSGRGPILYIDTDILYSVGPTTAAYDLDTQERKWSVTVGQSARSAIKYEDKLFIGTTAPSVAMIDVSGKTGAGEVSDPNWVCDEISSKFDRVTAITVVDDSVCCCAEVTEGEDQMGFYDIDIRSGEVRFEETREWNSQHCDSFNGIVYIDWRDPLAYDPGERELFEPDVDYGNSLRISDGIMYSTDDRIRVIDMASKEIIFKDRLSGHTDVRPNVSGDYMVVSLSTGIYGYNLRTEEREWHVRTLSDPIDQTLVDEFVFVVDDSGSLYGVNFRSGEQVYMEREAGVFRHTSTENHLIVSGSTVKAYQPVYQST